MEFQRHGLPEEGRIETALLDLAGRHGLGIVATNEPFFAKPDDYDAHDALLAIAEGRIVSDERRRRVTPSHAFKTRAEMAELFRDLPDALQATVEIAMRCAVRARTRKPILPNFGAVAAGETPPMAEALADAGETGVQAVSADEPTELRRQAEAGLELRLKQHGTAPGFSEEDYRKRLAFELDVIVSMKFPGYFLIVSDFIKWAKDHDIPVGPGRGSGAGSLVAWSLLITDLDPLRFGLLFERFLNPERVSMPDFDIDFCVEGRERVIRYVQQRYGEGQVGQIITFGTLLARGVLRDVGRVLEMPYGQVDKLTKLVPQNPANPVTLAQAIEGEPKLQQAMEEEPIVGRLIDISKKLEGLHRHASTHAAGVVIGDRPLEELVPLYRDPKTGMRVTQFNMKWVEQAGLVKFDFLGLKTLTMLRCCTRSAEAAGHRHRPREPAARRREHLQAHGPRRDGRRVPGGIGRHAQGALRDAGRPVGGHHRPGGALPAGPDGQHPGLLRAQARPRRRQRGVLVPGSEAGADAEGDLRHHRLPGTGDGDRQGAGRLLARRGRHAPARHGQEDPRRDGRAARPLPERLHRARPDQGQGQRDLRPPGQVRRLRLQQEPRGGLRAAHLPDGLPEGEPPRRVPGRRHDPRHRQHRQARRIPPGRAAPQDHRRAALDQHLGRGVRGARRQDLLRARRHQGRRPRGGAGAGRGPRRPAVQGPRLPRPPAESRG